MGAAHAARDPLLHHEAVERRFILGQVDAGCLQDHLLAVVEVGGQVDVAAVAGVQFALDAVAVEHGPRREHRGQRQRGPALLGFRQLGLGQRLNLQHLGGEVVVAAVGKGRAHQGAGSGLRVVRVLADEGLHRIGRQVFVHAVAGQHEAVAALQWQVAVIQFQMRLEAQRAAQVVLATPDPHPVVFGERLHGVAAQPQDAHVTGVEEMGGAALEHQHGHGADVAALGIVPVHAPLGLGMQPGVGGRQHTLHGALDAPGVRGGVVVLQHGAHGRLAGFVADLAAADAVGQGQHDALAFQRG